LNLKQTNKRNVRPKAGRKPGFIWFIKKKEENRSMAAALVGAALVGAALPDGASMAVMAATTAGDIPTTTLGVIPMTTKGISPMLPSPDACAYSLWLALRNYEYC
jgi:hypothetical protein